MKNPISYTNIKLLVKNNTLKTIKPFFLNNINKLLYKTARFIKFLIKTTTNIVVSIANVNFTILELIGDNL